MGQKNKLDFKFVFYLRCKGYNNQEIALKLNVARNSIQYRMNRFREMSDSEFNQLLIDEFFEDITEKYEEEQEL